MKAPTPRAIKMARTAAKLSMAQAAELIGYTRFAWFRWEDGSREMRPDLMELFKQKAKEGNGNAT